VTESRKRPPETTSTQSRARSLGPQQGALPDSVVTECELEDAPEKVWKALTIAEFLSAWLPEARNCETLAAEPPRLLRYRWSPGERDRDEDGRPLDSVVTFELTGTPTGGTYLRLTHQVLVDAVARPDTCGNESESVVPFAGPRRGDTVALAVAHIAAGVDQAANPEFGPGLSDVVPPIGPRVEPAALLGQLLLLRRAA
jgi:uncharacterized protein YndB with AHSA1/START domain